MHVDPLKFRVPKARCECGEFLDGATPAEHDCSPSAGDLTVCVYCARVLRFGEDLMPRAVSAEQFCELPSDVQLEVRKVARAVERVIASKR